MLDAQLKANPEWVSDLNGSLYVFLEEKLLEEPELHAKWIAFKQDIPELHAEMKALDKYVFAEYVCMHVYICTMTTYVCMLYRHLLTYQRYLSFAYCVIFVINFDLLKLK